MAKSRRIAILADFPWGFFRSGPVGRGNEVACTWLPQLAEAISHHDEYEIHWVSLDRERWFGRGECHEWSGQVFHRIPAGKLRVDLVAGYLASRIALLGCLRRLRPGLIHAWGTERSYPLACGAYAAPSILSMQGVLSNLRRRGCLPDGWLWRRLAAMEPGFIGAATVVTCESRWAMERVLEIVPGADVRQVEYGVHPSFNRVTWQPERDRPYALFVGTLSRAKGVDVLLEAFRRMGNSDWTLRVAGDGPLRGEVVAAHGVEYLGVLPWRELQTQMKGALCLVHPTLADSSPNVVKEARVVGLPVITTPHGGQAGYVIDGENGLLVDPLTADGLGAAMARLLGDPALAVRMGNVRHREDRGYFDPANTAEGFLRIYHELLAG